MATTKTAATAIDFFIPQPRLPLAPTSMDPNDSCEEEADWIRGHSLRAEPDEVVRNELADHEIEENDSEIEGELPLFYISLSCERAAETITIP